MKTTLAIAATLLMASTAFASKARIAALQNADQLTDTQTTFDIPTDLLALGEWGTFEMGSTPTNASGVGGATAEGGFAKAMGDAKIGFYLGHHDVKANNARAAVGVSVIDENPIDLFYAAKAGAMSWGVRLGYAAGEKKTTVDGKSDFMDVAASFGMDAWRADVGLVLTDKAKIGTTNDYKGKSQVHLKGAYDMDNMHYAASVDMNGGADDTTKKELAQTTILLQAVDSKKVDGGSFFYGVGLMNDERKDTSGPGAEVKVTTMSLPFIIGVEADATSWLVLRGSVTQNVLISSKKTDSTPANTATDATDTLANNTTVGAGAGLKFGKMTFDGTLAGATTGALNGTSLLATGSLTYNF